MIIKVLNFFYIKIVCTFVVLNASFEILKDFCVMTKILCISVIHSIFIKVFMNYFIRIFIINYFEKYRLFLM